MLTVAINFETIALLIRWANQLIKDDNMTNIYTPTMIEKMRKAQPLNQSKAKALADELGVSPQSIIAKTRVLGIAYDKKVRVAAKARATKADLVRELEQSLQGESLDGLQGASRRSLEALIMSIG